MIRAAQPADHATIAEILSEAFGGMAEAGVVAGLRAGGHVLAELVAETDGAVAGAVMLSRMAPPDFVVFGPLAIAPAHRARGLGSALVHAGLGACRAAGVRAVMLRGDPRFYGRLGFSLALGVRIGNRFAGPTLQAIELVPGALAHPVTLRHAPPFDALG